MIIRIIKYESSMLDGGCPDMERRRKWGREAHSHCAQTKWPISQSDGVGAQPPHSQRIILAIKQIVIVIRERENRSFSHKESKPT